MISTDEFAPGTHREIPPIGSPLEIMVKAVKARTVHELLGTTLKTPEEQVQRAFIVTYAALDSNNLPRDDESLQRAAQGVREILKGLLMMYQRTSYGIAGCRYGSY